MRPGRWARCGSSRGPATLHSSSSAPTAAASTRSTRRSISRGSPARGVTAFARDTRSGGLSLLNSRPLGGVEPAHVELDPGGRFLLVANYRSGSVAVFRLEADGSIGAMTDHVQHEGSSAHPVRQSGPHAHMIMFDPGSGDVLVPDLGVDAILFYQLSDEGKLTERPGRRIAAASGAGPRHLAFHPLGAYLLVVNELDNTLAALRRHRGWLRDHRCRFHAAGGISRPQPGRGDPGVTVRPQRPGVQPGRRERHDRRVPLRREPGHARTRPACPRAGARATRVHLLGPTAAS